MKIEKPFRTAFLLGLGFIAAQTAVMLFINSLTFLLLK